MPRSALAIAIAVVAACGSAPAHVATSGEPVPPVPPDMVRVADFLIDRYEVLAADYIECIAAGACAPLTPRSNTCEYLVRQGDDRVPAGLPMTCIETDVADVPGQYCAWRGKRLPTGREWLRAALGKEGRRYPWGDEPPDCTDVASCASPPPEAYPNAVWPWPVGVKARDVSPEGVYDLAGNVKEWTSDGWYGGSWQSIPPTLTEATHERALYGTHGFRCARDVTPSPQP